MRARAFSRSLNLDASRLPLGFLGKRYGEHAILETRADTRLIHVRPHPNHPLKRATPATAVEGFAAGRGTFAFEGEKPIAEGELDVLERNAGKIYRDPVFALGF